MDRCDVKRSGWSAVVGRAVVVAVAAVIAVLAIAPPVQAATLTITITDGLDPASVEVAPGTEITFVNADGERHRMRSDSGPEEFDTGNIEPGQSATFTLNALGTYAYADERSESPAYSGQIVVSSAPVPTTPGGGSPPPPPATATVSIGDRIYSPATVTVAVGGTVTWRNDDADRHTVTANNASFDSGLMSTGQSWARTYPAAGSFPYICDLHGGMTGTVRVVAADGSTPPPPPPPPTTTPPPPPPPPPTTQPPAPGTPVPSTASVAVINNTFSPQSATITAGGTVTWTNRDTVAHTVTASDGSYDSGIFRLNGTWSRTFPAVGSFAYVCDLHSNMTGTVVVVAPGTTLPGGTQPPAPPPTPTTTPPATTTPGAGTTAPGTGGSTAPGGSSGAVLPTTASVAIAANQFTPSSVTIAVGGTVTWTTSDSVPHTVTATDASFDSGIMRRGATWSRTFGAAGTYTYYCTLHPEMTGTVVAATPSDPSPAVVTGSSAVAAHPGASTTAAGAAGSGAQATGPGSASVTMANNAFSPASVTVGMGGTVTWTNTDTLPHTVTASDSSFDSDILMPGATFAWRFATPGTVTYNCTLHPGMTGTVVVTDQPAAPDGSAVGASGATAQAPTTPAASPDRTISINGNAFPAVTLLAAGHSVTWVNDDAVDHNVTALFDEFESPVLRPTEQFTVTFDEPGVHPYTCDLHPHMGGTIIVMPAEDVDLANSPTVAVSNGAFEPADLVVHQGTTVVWAFGGELPHTVTAGDGSFDSGILQPGATFTNKFEALGTYEYSCILHPTMVGTVTVVEPEAEIGADSADTSDGAGSAAGTAAGTAGAPGAASDRGSSNAVMIGIGIGFGLLASVGLAVAMAAVLRRSDGTPMATGAAA